MQRALWMTGNPFSNQTTFQYTLPQPAYIRLIIYDVLGREIDTLVDQPLPSGRHTTPFTGSNLSPGVYYARIESSQFYVTKKLVVIR